MSLSIWFGNPYKRAGRPKWYFDWRGADGKTHCGYPGYKDKQATKTLIREMQQREERIAAGMPVPSEAARFRPWDQITRAWLDDMERRGLSEQTITLRRQKMQEIKRDARYINLTSIRPDTFSAFLATLKQRGLSPCTVNHYRNALYAFCSFAINSGWLTENPLRNIKPAKNVKVHLRRALTPAEFTRLTSLPNCRAFMYKVAGLSGYRWNELIQLQKQDLTPFGPEPTWHPRPEIQKSHRPDHRPIMPELLPELAALWHSLPDHISRLFPHPGCHTTYNADLRRAQIDKLDSRGKVADFHSLRYTFCTHLARYHRMVTVQWLMRHADIRMTSTLYTDLGILELADQLTSTPHLVLNPSTATTTVHDQKTA